MDEMISRIGSSSSTTRMRSVVMRKGYLSGGNSNLTHSGPKVQSFQKKDKRIHQFMIYRNPPQSFENVPLNHGSCTAICVYDRGIRPAYSAVWHNSALSQLSRKISGPLDRRLGPVWPFKTVHCP